MAGGRHLFVVGEEAVQAIIQGYLGDQIVAQFANSTQRDSEWPTPPVMAVCMVNGQLQQFFTGTGGGWRIVNGICAAPSTRNTDAGPQGSEAAISGISVTVSFPANRRVVPEFTFSRCNGDTVNTEAMIRIKDNGTTIHEHQVAITADLAGSGGTIRHPYVPAAGSHTYTVTIQGIGGNITVLAGTSGNTPMELAIYDAGGV